MHREYKSVDIEDSSGVVLEKGSMIVTPQSRKARYLVQAIEKVELYCLILIELVHQWAYNIESHGVILEKMAQRTQLALQHLTRCLPLTEVTQNA